VVAQYTKFRCGEGLPEVKMSRWSFASTPPTTPKSRAATGPRNGGSAGSGGAGSMNTAEKGGRPTPGSGSPLVSSLDRLRLEPSPDRHPSAGSIAWHANVATADSQALSAAAQEFVPSFLNDRDQGETVAEAGEAVDGAEVIDGVPFNATGFPMHSSSGKGPEELVMSKVVGGTPTGGAAFGDGGGGLGHRLPPGLPPSGAVSDDDEAAAYAADAAGTVGIVPSQHWDGMADGQSGRSDSLQSQTRRLLMTLQEFSADELGDLLALSDSDLEGVLLLLLDRTDLKETEDEGHSHTKTPCKYFMQGRCFRSDCWFSHDLSSIPCKFYAAGWCQYENSCTFSHDERTLVLSAIKLLRNESLDVLDTPAGQAAAAVEPVQVPSMDEASFPALGASSGAAQSESASGTAAAAETEAGAAVVAGSLASKIKLKDLQAMFPTVWDDTVVDVFISCGYEIQAAERMLRERYPGTYVAPPKAPSTSLAPPPLSVKAGGKKLAPGIDWVDTGSSLGVEYHRLRDEAIRHAAKQVLSRSDCSLSSRRQAVGEGALKKRTASRSQNEGAAFSCRRSNVCFEERSWSSKECG